MPGVQATVTARRLPDAHDGPCPTCRQPRRWLSLRVHLGRRFVGEHLTEWCDTCDPEETP